MRRQNLDVYVEILPNSIITTPKAASSKKAAEKM